MEEAPVTVLEDAYSVVGFGDGYGDGDGSGKYVIHNSRCRRKPEVISRSYPEL